MKEPVHPFDKFICAAILWILLSIAVYTLSSCVGTVPVEATDDVKIICDGYVVYSGDVSFAGRGLSDFAEYLNRNWALCSISGGPVDDGMHCRIELGPHITSQ